MAGVRAFMAAYPYNCIEQLLSRAIVLGDQGAWQSLAGELPTYQAPDGLLRYFPSDSLQGSEALTAYVLSISSEAGLSLPEGVRSRMIEALTAVLDGRLRDESYDDRRLTKNGRASWRERVCQNVSITVACVITIKKTNP